MPQERVQQRTVEQHVDVRVPRVFQGCVEVASLTPHEQGQQRIVEPNIDVPVTQILLDGVELDM